MVPQIADDVNGSIVSYREPSRTYKFTENNVVSFIDKIQSIQQAVYCILSTERYSNVIYSDNYGVELEQFLNKDINYVKAMIYSVLYDALTQDDRIKDIMIESIELKEIDVCEVRFNVSTIYGTFDEQLQVKM